MSNESPLERGRENITEIVSVLVTGIWLTALLTGQSWWLAALLVGYVVVIPITELLFGDEDDDEQDWVEAEPSNPQESRMDSDQQDALETLRERYARGELTDEQFERKVERLLETETLEDVEDRSRERSAEESGSQREREHEFS